MTSPSRRPGSGEDGFLMAALLVAMAVMMIAMTAALPAWQTAARREKEAELIFRGKQYSRAIGGFQKKYGGAYPPTVDVLVNEKFLRKKYKDPITNSEFRYLSPLDLQAQPGLTMTTTTRPGLPGAAGATGPPVPGPNEPGRGQSAFGGPGAGIGGPSTLGPNGPTAGPSAGIAAVVSKSAAPSIKIFKNRRQYNQWIVTVQDVMPRSAVGTPQPDQPGLQPGQQPGRSGFGAPGASPGSMTPTPGMPTRPMP